MAFKLILIVPTLDIIYWQVWVQHAKMTYRPMISYSQSQEHVTSKYYGWFVIKPAETFARHTSVLTHYLFFYSDWSLKIRSLIEVTKGVDPSHLRLVCTASDSSGLEIAWRIYHSQCNVWETLRNDTDDRIVIEMNNVSSCVQTATLTILNYFDQLINGSIVMCLASSPESSENKTANFTIQRKC